LADLSTGADGPVLTVQEGKGRSLAAGDAPERLGLPGWLLGPLAAYLRGPRAQLGGPWLLPSPRDPTRPWSERALRIALSRLGETIGLPAASAEQPGAGLHPHRLRHTLATRLAEAGAARGEIKAVLRHRDSSVTGRYVHPGPGFVRAVLERLAPQG
jgi:integrase